MADRSKLESDECPEVRAIRDALGAIAMAEPAIYWLYGGEDGKWHVRREGDAGEQCFPNRELALAAVRLAVVRRASYCLFLQRADGSIAKECFNWLPRQPQNQAAAS